MNHGCYDMLKNIEGIITKESLDNYDLSFLENSKFGGWSLEKDTCCFIGKYCEEFKPKKVVEFGTGLSTQILANEASKGNIEKIWSIDHLASFPGHPKETLIKNNQIGFVDFYNFPIKLKAYAGKIFHYYDIPNYFFDTFGKLDLIIIDGPPYFFDSREAALYCVFNNLVENSLVLLDDANRKNREQKYMKHWEYYYGDNIASTIFLDDFKKGLGCVWLSGKIRPITPFKLYDRICTSWLSIKSALFYNLSLIKKFFLAKVK